MAWIAPVVGGAASVVGAGKGAKAQENSAQTAANGQLQMANQMFDKATADRNQQQQQLRSAVQGLIGRGNPFFGAGARMHPSYHAPGANLGHFGGGMATGGLPPSLTGTPPQPPSGGHPPQNWQAIIAQFLGNFGGGDPQGRTAPGGSPGRGIMPIMRRVPPNMTQLGMPPSLPSGGDPAGSYSGKGQPFAGLNASPGGDNPMHVQSGAWSNGLPPQQHAPGMMGMG